MSDLKELKPINYVQNLINKFCYTIGMIPTSYKMSLSYEEQILAIGHYLETVVYPAINNNAEAVSELQSLYVNLKNYVDNYFEDLDVQEEINNKLDEMAEGGQLTDIIAQYLQLAGVLAYDTKTNMKQAQNLVNGSIVKTLGNTSFRDGQGAFFKVRQIRNTDIVDDKNIIALYNTDLVAEKIQYSSGYDLQNQINEIKRKKTMIVIGDSFSNSAQSGTPLWYQYVSNALNLNVYTNASDGQGYGTGQNNFLVQLQTANEHFTDKSIIDRIYIVGGLNDLGNITGIPSGEDFTNNVNNVLEYAKTNFPNIPIYVYGILPFQYYNYYGNNNYLPDGRATNFSEVLSYCCIRRGVYFTQCSSFGLFLPDYYGPENRSNQRHPSAIGERAIANLILTNQRFYGIRNINNNGQTPTLATTIPIIEGTATSIEIVGTDLTNIYLKINGYNNSSALKFNLAHLPIELNSSTSQYHWSVTDEITSIDGWISPSYGYHFKIPPNKLNSGILYMSIPYSPLW